MGTRTQFRYARMGGAATAVVGIVLLAAVAHTAGQTRPSETPLGPSQLQSQIRVSRRQTRLERYLAGVNTANWDLEGQGGGASPVLALGAIGATPPGWAWSRAGRFVPALGPGKKTGELQEPAGA